MSLFGTYSRPVTYLVIRNYVTNLCNGSSMPLLQDQLWMEQCADNVGASIPSDIRLPFLPVQCHFEFWDDHSFPIPCLTSAIWCCVYVQN